MKNTKLFAAAAMMALALAATGCSSSSTTSSSSFIIENEKEGEASYENADVDSALSSGALLIEDGEQLVIEPALEEGEILVQLQHSEEEDIDNPVTFDAPDYEVTVSGSEPIYCELENGEYNLNLVVKEKANGTISMKVVAVETETTEAATETTEATEEAGGHTNWTECQRSPWASSEQWEALLTDIWTALRRSSAPQQRLR